MEKYNRIYTIFDESIVLSNNERLNAVEGFYIKNEGSAFSIKDVIHKVINIHGFVRHIPFRVVSKFTTADGADFYFNRNFIAIQSNGYKPAEIIALFNGNGRFVTTNLKFLIEFEGIIPSINHIMVVNTIGHLSTPYKAYRNDSYTWDNSEKYTIKLPFII